MADRDNDPVTSDTEELTPSGAANFVLNEFGETVSYVSPTAVSAAAAAAAPDPVMPAAIGRYEIRDLLGRGGFGAVYRGYDPHLDRQVAIKVPLLKPSTALAELFLQEARKLAQLKHPGIVTVHDVGMHEGACFIVSEYLDGRNLNRWMQNRPIPWPEAATITATLAEALAAAHARSIIHRDVKPANVIMTERADGIVPVLVDFGLALSESSPASLAAAAGRVTGTPNYMSPEQARGEGNRIDGRTDIYALGVILYRLISGRLPFTAADMRELLRAVVAHEPRPPRQFVRGLPRELERICLKAMAKNLADRYTTASDLAHDLRALVREHQDQLKLAATSASRAPTAGKRDAVKILIADDHELSRFKLQTDLEKWGHEVTAAEDGEQAWELFQRHRFAIVITDWMMPKLDGLELVKMIRSADCADYVYIIMLTAKAEKHDLVAGMGAGADDFLVKPFHRDELQVRLRAGIRITKLNRQLNETNRRLERGLEAAAQIQQSFLPSVKPQCEGYAFAWGHNPCGRLGGDMFNVVGVQRWPGRHLRVGRDGRRRSRRLAGNDAEPRSRAGIRPHVHPGGAKRRRVGGARSRAGGGCPRTESALWHATRGRAVLHAGVWCLAPGITPIRAHERRPPAAALSPGRPCAYHARHPGLSHRHGSRIRPVSAALAGAPAGRPNPHILRRDSRRHAWRRRGIRRRWAPGCSPAFRRRAA